MTPWASSTIQTEIQNSLSVCFYHQWRSKEMVQLVNKILFVLAVQSLLVVTPKQNKNNNKKALKSKAHTHKKKTKKTKEQCRSGKDFIECNAYKFDIGLRNSNSLLLKLSLSFKDVYSRSKREHFYYPEMFISHGYRLYLKNIPFKQNMTLSNWSVQKEEYLPTS